jgi:cell division protein FtsB
VDNTEETKRHPILNLPQFLIIAGAVLALVLTLSLDLKGRENETLGAEEAALATLVAGEELRQEQLVLTLTYVASDDYVADYARDEGGMLLPGERRVVPLPNPPPPTPTPIPTPVHAASGPKTPFEAWWRLFFDGPAPLR